MDISIVIPTHFRHEGVLSLLKSLHAQELQTLKVEVLIISNLTDDFLKARISEVQKTTKFPLQFFSAGKLGVNAARNVGLREAHSSRVLFLDDDVLIVNPRYLHTFIEHSNKNPGAAIIGGRYLKPEKLKGAALAYFHICNSWITKGTGEFNSGIHLVGGNSLYNKLVLKDRLKFNEDIVFGGSETELNYRISLSGEQMLLFEDIGVIHNNRLNLWGLIKKALWQGRGSTLYLPREAQVTQAKGPRPEGPIRIYFYLYDFFFKLGQLYTGKVIDSEVKLRPIFFFSLVLAAHLFYRRIIHMYFWRLPWAIKWHLFPLLVRLIVGAVWLLFPFNTIGLYSIYIEQSKNLERYIAKALNGLFFTSHDPLLIKTVEDLSLRLNLGPDEKKRLIKLTREFSQINWAHALGESQLSSKIWLTQYLSEHSDESTTIVLIGGWVGLTAYLLELMNIKYKNCVNIDLDPDASSASKGLNMKSALKNKFSGIHGNALDFKYQELDSKSIIINTSTEHLSNYKEWVELIPSGVLCVLQSNNMFGADGHVNCKNNLQHFISDCELSRLLHAEEKIMNGKWLRFMLAGTR